MLKVWRNHLNPEHAVFWMLFIILTIEISFHVVDMWRLEKASAATDFDRVVEASLLRSPSPKILVLGSSRLQYAVNPAVVEQNLGLDDGDVSNLAFLSGTAQDHLDVFNGLAGEMNDLEVLIVEVGAFSYNGGLIQQDGQINIRFRRLSNFSDRFFEPELGDKATYIVGYISRIWDFRRELKHTITSTLAGDLDQWGPSRFITANQNGQMNVDRLPILEDDFESPAAWEFYKFRFSEYQLKNLVNLVETAKSNNLSIVLLEPAVSPEFTSSVVSKYLDEDQLWRNRVESVTGLQIHSINHSDESCARWENCAYDYGHMNQRGAVSYSHALSTFLATEIGVRGSAR